MILIEPNMNSTWRGVTESWFVVYELKCGKWKQLSEDLLKLLDVTSLGLLVKCCRPWEYDEKNTAQARLVLMYTSISLLELTVKSSADQSSPVKCDGVCLTESGQTVNQDTEEKSVFWWSSWGPGLKLTVVHNKYPPTSTNWTNFGIKSAKMCPRMDSSCFLFVFC